MLPQRRATKNLSYNARQLGAGEGSAFGFADAPPSVCRGGLLSCSSGRPTRFVGRPEAFRSAGILPASSMGAKNVKNKEPLSSRGRASRESLLAANVPRTKVMEIRSFCAVRKSIRSFRALTTSAEGSAVVFSVFVAPGFQAQWHSHY
jgi:hypothetical protein